MNPVGMHEVNRAEHQDRERTAEARRRALAAADEGRGLFGRLLAKLRTLARREKRQAPARKGGQPKGRGVAEA